jgi:tRNA(Ile)-lysidine synthase
MKIEFEPGKYVVAVSGGVDSVVLLDLLASQLPTPSSQLIVAHYDHGIRSDSAKDQKFVAKLAKQYGLEFYTAEGELGSVASEELAREKRYEFLRKVKNQTKSDAIITAHHQDDLVETAIINIIRGTGRKGLSALKSTKEIKRPLLPCNKPELIDYARKNNLKWREDPSNLDQKYLRNYVRRQLVARMNAEQRTRLLAALRDTKLLNKKIDGMLGKLSSEVFDEDKINTIKFRGLSHDLSKELLAHWLRAKNIRFDKRGLERLVVFAKTARSGAKADITKDYILSVQKNYISLSRNQSL